MIRITHFATGIMEKLKLLQEGANVDELLETEIIEKSAEKVEHEIQSIFRENADVDEEISKNPILVNGEKGGEELKMCDNSDKIITGEISENITQNDDIASENITSASENITTSENINSSDPNSETNNPNKNEEIPPTIPLRKSKRKFLDVSTQTESLGLAGCICCCTCGRSTPDDNIA